MTSSSGMKREEMQLTLMDVYAMQPYLSVTTRIIFYGGWLLMAHVGGMFSEYINQTVYYGGLLFLYTKFHHFRGFDI